MNNYRKHIIFWLIILSLFTAVACEEIYNPNLKAINNYLVIEAKLFTNNQHNNIRLYKSKNFEDNAEYEGISGAIVTLISDKGEAINAYETDTTGTYRLDYILEQNKSYYISVQTGGEYYQSEYQFVPQVPSLDTVYGEYGKYIYTQGTSNSADNIVTKYGVRLYADMLNSGKSDYYRFNGRMILQYILNGTATFTYAWKSYYPVGLFNIASPPEYSTQMNVIKHPLEFFNSNYWDYFPDKYVELVDSALFEGWIYIIDEYGLNESTYKYYTELNSQLGADGKIFDTVYLQTKGNIKCISNPDIIVLGNFEISSHKEYRYFLKYNNGGQAFTLKKIPYFYDISEEGKVVYYYATGSAIGDYDFPPNFWEREQKDYP